MNRSPFRLHSPTIHDANGPTLESHPLTRMNFKESFPPSMR